jgi:hypothetical protein
MLEILRYFIIFLALISGIIGVLYWNKLSDIKAKLFLLSIWISAIIDFTATKYSEITGLTSYIIYNVYNVILFSIYILILKLLLKKQKYKNLAIFFLAFFIVGYLLNYYFLQPEILEKVLTNGYALGVVLITILSSLYLLELFSTNYALNYCKSIYFWFILGILIFHVPFLPFMLSLKWFLIDYNQSVYYSILFFLNLLMNGCFIIGFVWSEKKYNY